MKKFFFYFYLLVLSIILGFSLFVLTRDLLIKDVGWSNYFTIDFTYLRYEGNFNVLGYDKEGNIIHDRDKYVTFAKENEEVLIQQFSFLIPYIASHKVELTFEGINNLIYIDDLSINGQSIDINDFINNIESPNHYRLGTQKDRKGVFIELKDDKVVFDVTNVYKPLQLTFDDLEKFEDDYTFLSYAYLSTCVLICFLIQLIFYKISINDIKFTKNGELTNKNNKLFIYIASLVSIVVSIHTSYYLEILPSIKNSVVPGNMAIENNALQQALKLVLFEQNLLPILFFIILLLIFSSFLKSKILKFISCFVVISVEIIFLADNCIHNVLGTRLNFKFGGEFGGEAKYFIDFIIKYVLSTSGQLLIFAFVLSVIIIVLFSFKNYYRPPKKLVVYSFIITAFSAMWGFYPSEQGDDDFTVANVFQINGYSFQTVGNFMKPYGNIYAPRDELSFVWNTKTGLNKQQNVILVLVESLGCNFTYICGSGPSYMPNIERIAKENLFFDNYYSIVPSTALSYLSIVKGIPTIQVMDNDPNELTKKYAFELYKKNDLIEQFNKNGYITKFISSTDHVFGMRNTISLSNYGSIIDAQDKAFSHVKDRYVFNSVSDKDLFKYIVKSIKNDTTKQKFFYVTKTASNHSPYSSPLGFNNLEKAFEYTDGSINYFISELEKINYFKNGIVVLVGDHHAWHEESGVDSSHPTLVNKVPLIIVDGKRQGVVNHTEFSHASLGGFIQYLELPNYISNQFNVNPLDNPNNDSEIIFGYDYQKFSLLAVKHKEKEAYVMLSGNDSDFLNKEKFTKEEQNTILGFIAWFRR